MSEMVEKLVNIKVNNSINMTKNRKLVILIGRIGVQYINNTILTNNAY